MVFDLYQGALDENGDGTGNKVATGDYSGAPTEFKVTWPLNSPTNVALAQLIVAIGNGGDPNNEEYGDTGNPLTNGITVIVRDDQGATFRELTDKPIKSNIDWGRLCAPDYGRPDIKGDQYVMGRWNFVFSGGPVLLEKGWELVVQLNDDFTDLNDHTFNVQGTPTNNRVDPS